MGVGLLGAAFFVVHSGYSAEVRGKLHSTVGAVGVHGVVVLWVALVAVVLAARDKGRKCGAEF